MSEGFVSLRQALTNFADSSLTQSQAHIRMLHRHIAERLVLEGGFSPDNLLPRPPLRIETLGTGVQRRLSLVYDQNAEQPGELTILGGLKTKAVDVVVTKHGIGPCLAISIKGTLHAFRNLTNRMEEAVGDCTNLHISYPNLVYGFLHVLRANRSDDVDRPDDIAVDPSGEATIGIRRYLDAIARLSGRRDVRNDVSRYEAVSVALVDTQRDCRGMILESFPPVGHETRFEDFFEILYRSYDARYVYAAPAIRKVTERHFWDPESPAFQIPNATEFNLRVADS